MIKKIKQPFSPTKSINKEHKNGPLIAPIPKANCKPAPAETNFSLATKSLVDMGFRNVAHVSGGFGALKDAGLKVVVKEKK